MNTPRRATVSYRLRAFLFILALVLVALAGISAAFYSSNRSFLKEYIQEINATQAKSSARLLDSVFYRASYASAAVAERSTVRTYLSSRPSSEPEIAAIEQGVQDLVSLFARANDEIASIYVYAIGRQRIVTDRLGADLSQFHDRTWTDVLDSMTPTRPILLHRLDPVFETPTLSIIRRIDEGKRHAGAVVVNLNVDSLRRLIGRRTGTDDLSVVMRTDDGSLRIVFSTDADRQGAEWKPTAAVDTEFVANASGNLFNLEYYLDSGRELFAEKSARLRRFLTLLLAGILLLGAFLSVVLASYAYRPIRDILDTIEHPERHRRPGDRDRDEIRYIEDSVIGLIASNQNLERRLSQRFQSLRRAHYAALQLQINPHFLYNTLESIYWNSVEAFAPEDTVPRSVAALARFLRMILATDGMAVPLAEEQTITTEYVNLLQLRFQDRLQVEWHIPASAARVYVPKLILQPLVENAFYHGIKPLRRRGSISIGATVGEHGTTISVRDDGAGMTADRLEAVRSLVSDELDMNTEHIGLPNVAQRLQILYGDAAAIAVSSASGSGTTVTITVPSAPGDGELDTIVPPM